MKDEREILVEKIENARKRLNDSIDAKEDYGRICDYSVELDRLIEEYIVAGY